VIVGYDQHSGRRLWRVKPPPASGYRGNGPTIFCGTSSALSGAMLAVAFGKRGQCALVAAIDVYFTDRCVLSGVVQYGTIDTAAATMRGSSVMPGAVPFKLDRADLVSANPLVILLRADGLSRGEYLRRTQRCSGRSKDRPRSRSARPVTGLADLPG
jgi:hypothetical protein